MPVKPLPLALVKRLRSLVKYEVKRSGNEKRAYKLLGKMINVDSRFSNLYFGERGPKTTSRYFERVRKMNVSKSFPGTELVIKRVHNLTAKATLDEIQATVRNHNLKYKPNRYILLEPPASVIGKYLIAMPKVKCPTVFEVLERGDKAACVFFDNLIAEHKVNRKMFIKAAELLLKRTTVIPTNVWLLGVKEAKFFGFLRRKLFVFMLLIESPSRERLFGSELDFLEFGLFLTIF